MSSSENVVENEDDNKRISNETESSIDGSEENSNLQSAKNACCDIFTAKPSTIEIIDAEKVSGETGNSYIVYSINFGNSATVKRRYSEFESVRKILEKRYPFCAVPPIPEKHSLVDYAKKQGKAKDDPCIIEHRKTMLESFLRKTLRHEILGSEHLFHRFLEPGQWADVLFSQSSSRKEKPLTKVGFSQRLKNPDLKFIELEQANETFGDLMSSLEKSNKKMSKKYGDLSEMNAELGAILNAMSLHENKSANLSKLIERTGQASDLSQKTTEDLKRGLRRRFGDFIHEQYQMYLVIRDLLKTRHSKHAQYEDLCEQLDIKRIQLTNLENRGPNSVTASNMGSHSLMNVMSGGFDVVSSRIQQLLDGDPEITRLNQIAKLRDTILNLEKYKEDTYSELNKFSEKVQEELVRVEDYRKQDMRQLISEFVRLQLEWFTKSVRHWELALRMDG